MFRCLNNVKTKSVMIHNITNYVTVNDVANSLIACGARPIMADAKEEVQEIVSICNGLYINIGTLNSRTLESMLIAGEMANKLNIPVVLDPVGVGASKFRTDAVKEILRRIKISVLRGNITEIKAIINDVEISRGVDCLESDSGELKTIDGIIEITKELSYKYGCIVVATGIIDVITQQEKVYLSHNGHAMMSEITGTGCMLGAIIAAYISANRENECEAALAATVLMGCAGELAFEKLDNKKSNLTYRQYLIDSIAEIDCLKFKEMARYEIK